MDISKSRVIVTAVLFSLVILISACGGKSEEIVSPPELPEDAESLVMLAKFDLSLRTGVDIEQILTESLEETLFDDSSLDVPQPGDKPLTDGGAN